MIGVLELPGVRLDIQPKIGFKHFAFLVSRCIGVPSELDAPAMFGDGTDFLDLLALWFLCAAEAALRDGLPVSFVEQQYVGSHARGRLDARKTVHDWSRFRYDVHSVVDELSVDNPANRLIKAAASLLCTTRMSKSPAILSRAASLVRSFEGVGGLRVGDLTVQPSRSTRSTARTAIDLALRILRSQLPTLSSGKRRGDSFLIDTPLLVEEALRLIVRSAISPTSVTAGQLTLQSAQGSFSLNPDLVIAGGVVVGDVKYKVWDKLWDRDDVAQSVFFATGYRASSGVILAFASDPLRLRYDLLVGDLPVTILIWDASNPDPGVEMTRFSGAVQEWWRMRDPSLLGALALV